MSTKNEAHNDSCQGPKLDPRVARTRQMLQKALRELLCAGRRFSEITVQDIAEIATVNRATFYAHFDDKYALLEDMLGSDLTTWLKDRLVYGAPFDRQNVRAYAKAVIEFMGDMYSGCTHKREFGPLMETTIQHRTEEMLRGWIDHVPRTELNEGKSNETIANVYSWAFFGAGMRWARAEKRPPIDKYVDEVVETLLGKRSAA